MTSSAHLPPMIVPYGTSTVSRSQAAAIAEGDMAALNRPGAPAARIEPDSGALRIHALDHPFTRPPVAQDLAHAAAQAAFLEAHLDGLCGMWNRPLRALVGGYFRAMRGALRSQSGELEPRAGALAGLAEPDHWLFSVPMPLPRAHLPMQAEFTTCDLAFWDGRETICCFAETGTVIGARRRAMDRLAATEGIRVEPIDRRLVNDDDALRARLGPAFEDPTGGETLPQSPFKGRPIADPA